MRSGDPKTLQILKFLDAKLEKTLKTLKSHKYSPVLVIIFFLT